MNFRFEHRGKIAEYCFLNTDSRLDEEDRFNLVINVFDSYLDKKKYKKVKGKNYEGRIVAVTGHFRVGFFSGQKFEILLETDYGKSNLSCLVNEINNPLIN